VQPSSTPPRQQRPEGPAASEPSDYPPPPRTPVAGEEALAGLQAPPLAHAPKTHTADEPGTEPVAGLPSAVPGYEVLEVLGRGGMGVVSKARQVQLHRVVALKMILAGAHAGEEERARFLAEAEAVARLQHPNVVQIFETGTHDGLPFMALEFVEGGSLANKVQDASLPPREAAALVEQLARGMAEAHSRGVVHRDLKPANVLLAADGTPKITDFGLAKRVDVGEGLTVSGAIMGTPSYMAPEQAAGRSKAVGPAADVYALGAILYRLLAGRPPFPAATTLDTMQQVLTEEPVPPAQLQRGLPRDLETVCLRALEKDPARRYAGAAALAEALQRFLTGEPVHARPVSGWERGWRWVKRRPVAAALVGVSGLLLLALVGLVVGGLAYEQVQAARQAAESEREEANRQKGRAESAAKEADRQRGVAETAQKEADRQRRRAELLESQSRADRPSRLASR
jgi:tRNA A-37 threonylcarbamoyl transferase component Bud32